MKLRVLSYRLDNEQILRRIYTMPCPVSSLPIMLPSQILSQLPAQNAIKPKNGQVDRPLSLGRPDRDRDRARSGTDGPWRLY